MEITFNILMFDILISGLCLAHKVFAITDTLSRAIQSPEVTASKARELAVDVCSILQNLRKDEGFDRFLSEVNQLANNLGRS